MDHILYLSLFQWAQSYNLCIFKIVCVCLSQSVDMSVWGQSRCCLDGTVVN